MDNKHVNLIVNLGYHFHDKMADMGKVNGDYPVDFPKQISVGLYAADVLFSGKHALPEVIEAVSEVRRMLNAGELPTWH